MALSGRPLTLIHNRNKQFVHYSGPDPAHAPRISPNGLPYSCHSLDFYPGTCALYSGQKQADKAKSLKEALRRSSFTTQTINQPNKGQMGPGIGIRTPPGGPNGVKDEDAAVASRASNLNSEMGEHGAMSRLTRHDTNWNSERDQDDSGISFVLNELFGGPNIGATAKARKLKMLILGGAQIHGGSIKVIRRIAAGRQQIINVGLNSEILLRLIELAEQGVEMKDALSVITESLDANTRDKQAEREMDHVLEVEEEGTPG